MRFLIPLALLLISGVAQTSQAPRAPRNPVAGAPAEAVPPTVKPEDKCAIEGTVVNAITGEALNKAHLTLRPLNQPNGVPYATTTDNAGRFLLDDVDPGRYTFSAVRNLFVNQSYSPDGNLKRSTTLTLRNGQKLKDIVFKLTPQGVITGRVFDQDGEPLANVRVISMTFTYRNGKRQPMPGGGASTNDLGEYRIFGLRPGKYVLAATYQQQGMMQQERAVGSAQALQAADEGYSTTYYPNSTTPDGASRIEVTPGGQILGMDMKLVQTRTYRLKGRLTLALPSQSHRNVMLMLNPRDLASTFNVNRRMTQVTDPKGTFEIRGVAPGSYVITGYYQEDGVNYTVSVPVDVGNANVEGVEVTLQPPAELAGHVVVEENGDLKGANLNVYLQAKSPNPMMGGSNGGPVKDDLTFKIANVGRETYDFSVFGLPEGFYLKSVRLGNQDVTFTGVDFTQANPAGELVAFVNPNGGQIEGTVQNAKSENATGAMVTLIPDESRRSTSWLYKTASTDQNGHFSMKGLAPGEYKIYSWEEIEQGAHQDPEFVKPHESAGKSLSIKESGHETVQLTAIPAESTAAPK